MATSNPSASWTMLYKILTPAEFTALPMPPSPWNGTPFDTLSSPPGIHLSTSTQLPLTLKELFSHPTHEDLWILAIPLTPRLKEKVEWENERSGCATMRFPEGEGLDVWTEVAVRRPIKRVEGEWEVGPLEY